MASALPSVELSILDVGQGDCIVLHDPEHAEAVLIDCPAGRGDIPLRHLSDRKVKRVRAVIVSHLHRDHYGGIEEALPHLALVPDELWLSVAYAQGKTSPPGGRAVLNQLNRFARTRGISRTIPMAASRLVCSRMRLAVLSPDDSAQLDAIGSGDPNWSSLIVKADLGGYRALFGADAPATQWERVIAQGADVRADVLLMPHHGGSFASDPDRLRRFLDAVSPSVVVLSVGAVNAHGHPERLTLDALGAYARSNDARLICTQLNRLCNGRRVPAGRSCAGTISISGGSGALSVATGRAAHDGFVAALPSPRCT
jgi:competence protein ComEC